MALSNGSLVITCAPPTAAEKVVTVFRSRFTHGSRAVSTRLDVRTCICIDAAASPAPQDSSSLVQSFRAARSLAVARKKLQPSE